MPLHFRDTTRRRAERDVSCISHVSGFGNGFCNNLFVGCYVLLRDCFIMLLPCHLGAYLAVAPAAAAAGCLRLHGVQGPTVRQTTFICADDTLLRSLSVDWFSLFAPP